MKKTTKSAKTCPELVEWICLPWRSCRLAKTGVNSWIKMNLVNPVIPSKNVILSDAKVEYTGCPITMLILKNEPNFPHFSPKNKDFTKKRTQTKPIQTQFFGFSAVRSPRGPLQGTQNAERQVRTRLRFQLRRGKYSIPDARILIPDPRRESRDLVTVRAFEHCNKNKTARRINFLRAVKALSIGP
jgi:hypothetical protein